MKLNKKGFTLVELLAVIVVLAIIALIGYSAVGGIIKDSAIDGATQTASNLEKAAELYCMKQLSDSTSHTAPTSPVTDYTEFDFDPKGSEITDMSVSFGDGCSTTEFATGLKINGYACSRPTNADGTKAAWTCS